MTVLRIIALALAAALLSGCGADRKPLVVGGKSSPQDEIVAEMVAMLAEDAGIPVTRRIGLGSTRVTLAAMKRGDIDIYPEYTGTGLAMLGLPAIADPDEALARLRERFAPLGLGWSDLLGFDNDYGLAMLRGRAQPLGIQTFSDLASHSAGLVLGVEDEFRMRPVDGLQSLQRRYGMQFAGVVEVPLADRMDLYDKLLRGQIDVSLVYNADPQIDDFDLRRLEDDQGFFAGYAAALLYRDAALARFPALGTVLEQLTGELDIETMRQLTARVTLGGEDPAEVARMELVRLGLLRGVAAETTRQALNLAISPSANADGEAATVLRALRRSFPTRNVQLSPTSDPLDAVEAGRARVALVSAPAFFAPGSIDPATGQPPLRSGVEAVALVGTSYLHAFALEPDLGSLAEAAVIATSAEGSSGHRTAQSLVDALGLSAMLRPVDAGDAEGLADAIVASGADAAVLMQPIGNWTALALLEQGYRLLSVTDWNRQGNRLIFPYLQPAQLSPSEYAPYLQTAQFTASDYPQLREPVETLVTQLVLAGPAPHPHAAVGDQGPGASFIPQAVPLTDLAVERINAALGQPEQINPILPQARALAPQLPHPPNPVNPSPAVSLLTALVVAMLIWMVWLLVRAPRAGGGG